MKKVIKLSESDIENLINKIMSEEEVNEVGFKSFKKEDLKPGVATIDGQDRLVIVNTIDEKVEAVGPPMDILKDKGKEGVCKVAENLIEELFHLEEGLINELDRGKFKNIRPINFCSVSENKKIMGGMITEFELEDIVSMVIKEEKANPNPCWKGYEMVGMKEKNGKEVPNCVPVKENGLMDETEKRGD